MIRKLIDIITNKYKLRVNSRQWKPFAGRFHALTQKNEFQKFTKKQLKKYYFSKVSEFFVRNSCFLWIFESCRTKRVCLCTSGCSWRVFSVFELAQFTYYDVSSCSTFYLIYDMRSQLVKYIANRIRKTTYQSYHNRLNPFYPFQERVDGPRTRVKYLYPGEPGGRSSVLRLRVWKITRNIEETVFSPFGRIVKFFNIGVIYENESVKNKYLEGRGINLMNINKK